MTQQPARRIPTWLTIYVPNDTRVTSDHRDRDMDYPAVSIGANGPAVTQRGPPMRFDSSALYLALMKTTLSKLSNSICRARNTTTVLGCIHHRPPRLFIGD